MLASSFTTRKVGGGRTLRFENRSWNRGNHHGSRKTNLYSNNVCWLTWQTRPVDWLPCLETKVMTFTLLKNAKLDRLLKRQEKFDPVVVFDEDFENLATKPPSSIFNQCCWLSFVDFCPTYKYSHNEQCINTASYE